MSETNKTVTEGCMAQVEIGSRAWLLDTQIETFKKITEMTRRKNADYAGKGGDAFNNFTRVEGLCPVITTEMGFFVRLTDKFSRIGSFIQNGELQVKDESVEDTLLDLSNYAFLFYAFLKAKKMKAEEAKSRGEYQAKLFTDAIEYRREKADRAEKAENSNRITNFKDSQDKVAPITKESIDRSARTSLTSTVEDQINELAKKLPVYPNSSDIKLHLDVVGREYADVPRHVQEELAFLRMNVCLHQDALLREQKNNGVILHENKRLAVENVTYKAIGTPSQIQQLFAKMDLVLGNKIAENIEVARNAHEHGDKKFVHPDHKSFIGGSTSEGSCTEDYTNPRMEIDRNEKQAN